MRPVPLLLALLAAGQFAFAAEAKPPAAEPTPPANEPTDLLGGPEASVSKAEAEALVEQGKLAMIESNDNVRRSVDAAVHFSKALKYYEQIGDTDKICDLEANIFWCKKRMNLDDVKTFVAQKSGDKSVVAALAKADQVATKEVSKDKAEEYFARAEKFAAANPDKYDQISVRFFEVAERFVGTETGIKAQKVSLSAQQSQMKAIKAAQDAQRETLFSKPTTVTGKIQQAALPSAETQKASLSTIRSLYKADFAKKKPNQKVNLLNKLMEQARTTKDDPTMLHGLLTSVIDLGMDCQEFYSVIYACDLMAASFTGVDAKAQKKAVFSKTKNVTVMAIVKLLDNPEDADANTVAGKYFAYDAQEWELGIPLLMHGADAELKTIAEMEMLKPEGAPQQLELADKWYDIGKKGRKGTPTLEGPMSRAMHWYQLAEKKITGISKDRIAKRLDEIDGLLPMTNLNYDNLTAKQWDRLKGSIVVASAARDRNDTGLRLTPGKKYRLVPNPTDTWQPTTYYTSTNNKSVTWKGMNRTYTVGTTTYSYGQPGDFMEGSLVMQIENGKMIKPGLVEGEGRLWIGPYSADSWGAGGKGEIRCKILPADDE